MSERSFYEERAKREAQATVEAIEAQTSAEIVVCLRGSSGSYRDADYLFGLLSALGALLALTFVARPAQPGSVPAGVVAAFLLGAVVSANLAGVRRLLLFRRRLLHEVRTAARAEFVDMGVSRTEGRTGILLYISMFERRVEVVPDIGVDARALGPEWKAAVATLEGSLDSGPDVGRLLAAMRELGPVLGRGLPREEPGEDPGEQPSEE